MINQKPQRVFFSLGLVISRTFILIQLLPPASRVRLSEILDATVGSIVGASPLVMMITETMFLRLRFVIFYYVYIHESYQTRTSFPNNTAFTMNRISYGIDGDYLIRLEDKVSLLDLSNDIFLLINKHHLLWLTRRQAEPV
ncbi:MAG: hypothetical protein J2P21_05010 [Chloracidobacterium sp.]|nr:hypothetical protein [Chloracidobacterium sp.]